MTLKLILCILTVYLFVSCQTKDADVNITVPPQENTQTPEAEKNQDKEIVKTDELQELIDLSFEGKDKVKENDDVTLLGKPLSQYVIDPKTDPVWKSILEPTIEYYKTHLPEIAEHIEKSMSNVSIVQSPVPLSRLRVRMLNENKYLAKIISRSENHIWVDSVLFNESKPKEYKELIQREILIRMLIQDLIDKDYIEKFDWDGSWTDIFIKLQKFNYEIEGLYNVASDIQYKIEKFIKMDIFENLIKKYVKNDFHEIFYEIIRDLHQDNSCSFKIEKDINKIIVHYENNQIEFKNSSKLSYRSNTESHFYSIKDITNSFQLDLNLNQKTDIYIARLSKIDETFNSKSFENLLSCEMQGVSK